MTGNNTRPPLLAGGHALNTQALAWLMLGVAALGASTLFAILVASSRAPATARLLSGHDFFQVALILHVTLGPVLWFLAFAMALWNLPLQKAWDGLGWLGFGLAALGSAVMVLVPMGGALGGGTGEAILSNYIPVLRSPMFLTGLALFGGGFAISLIRILRWLRPGILPTPERALGWGLLAAALAGAAALGSLAWSAAALPGDLPHTTFYEMMFWGPGHILQSMHVLLMMVAWLMLADAANIPLRSSAKTQRLLFLLALLPVLAAPLVHLAYPPESAEFRNAFTELMRWTIWPGVTLLAADILYGLAAGRFDRPSTRPTPSRVAAGVTRPTQWTAATWALVLSIVLLVIGLAIGLSISENNAVVPAHYHATTGAITMAYLGIAIMLLSRLGYTASPSTEFMATELGTGVARWPVIAYGAGTLMMAAALAWAGYSGLTRKVPGSEKALEGYSPHLTVIAIGGTLVIIGGIGFVVIMLRRWLRASVLSGWKIAALLSVAGLIMAAGIVFTLLPGSGATPPAPAKADPHTDPQRHMQQAQADEVSTRFQQAVVMLHAKRHEEAITALQRVLKLEPGLPEAHVNMGFALLGLQRYDAARSSFETAIDLRPAQANAYYGLALAMKGSNDTEGAIGAMRSYIHLSPPDDPYLSKARADLAEWEAARGHKPGKDLPAVKTNRSK